VVISGGVFHDLRAVVLHVMPSRRRVALLLEFLGRQTSVELDIAAVVREGEARGRIQKES
jgi:transcription antitermination factor NusG